MYYCMHQESGHDEDGDVILCDNPAAYYSPGPLGGRVVCARHARAGDVRILPDDVPSRPSITCLHCNMTSYSVDDVRNRYCGNCRRFIDAMVLVDRRTGRVRGLGGPA